MKIESIPTFIETSSNFESHQFGIDDLSMIFEILRSKLYSNPIGSIVREVSCNARDAHREVGKETLPIEIHLPSRLEPTFEVRDFGPGISKERMANVFVKYAASTKRSDNFQNGGFGLGAKTPFSYTDSFTIVTCVNGTKSTYAAYIDETRVGKVDLISEINTDEPNGTRIIVPVKPEDFNYFRDEVMKNLYFWQVKPVLKGISPIPNFNTNKGLEVLISGTGWELWKTNQNYSYNYLDHYQDTSSATILIDDIPYRVKASDIGVAYDRDCAPYRNLLERRLRIYFNIGELTLSANREHIHFDEKTQSLIKDRLKSIIETIETEAQNKINTCTCLSDAEITLNDIQSVFVNIISNNSKFTWNGIALNGIVIKNIPSLQHVRILNFSYAKNRKGVLTLSQEQVSRLVISNDNPIYIHNLDIDHMPILRIRKFLEDNDLKNIQVVKFDNTSVMGEWDKQINFNLLTTHNLSEMPIPEKTKRTKSNSVIKAELYKFNPYAYRQSHYWEEYTSEKAIADAGDDKVIYVILKDKRANVWVTSNEISAQQCTTDTIKIVNEYFSKHVVGIREKDIKKIDPDVFISLGEFLSEKFEEYSNTLNIQNILSAKENKGYSYYNKNYHMFNIFKNNLSKIKDTDSLLIKYINQSIEINKLVAEEDYDGKDASKIRFLTYCHSRLFPNKIAYQPSVHSIKNTYDSFIKKYPLLSFVEDYNVQAAQISAMIDYVNMVDAINAV